RAKISRQPRFCKDRGAALLVARCCGQERGHNIYQYTITAWTLMGLVRVPSCVFPEQL
ncbi:unnamed protein product, partial [Ascophyllum nodosum]